MKIDSLEKITINDSEQWILVRGRDVNAPMILQVQAGPGFPMIPEAKTMERNLGLENDFLVVYWDLRGCGKSYSKELNPETINFKQLPEDVISCTEYLLKKYKKEKLSLVGFSLGATLSLMAAAKNSSLFDQIFLAGIDIDLPVANKFASDFMISKSKENNNSKNLKKAIELSKVEINNSKLFQDRAKLITNFGGIKMNSSYNKVAMSTVSNMLYSKSYHLSDIPRALNGMDFCQNAFLSEMNTLNLFDRIQSVDVSVHFIQGKQDAIAPFHIAVKYYEYLKANKKTFTIFEHSAHMPHYDEPKKFSKLIRDTLSKS